MQLRNSILAIIMIVVLLGVVGAAVYFVSRNFVTEGIVLSLETGTVSYKQPSDKDYQTLSNSEMTIASGSMIKTGVDSYARIYLPNDSLISIDAGSEVKVSWSKSQADVQIVSGRVWSRVKEKSGNDTYNIQSPNVTADVTESSFSLGVDGNGVSQLFVINGTVNATKFKLENDKQSTQEEVSVEAGKMADFKTDTKTKAQDISAQIKAGVWYLRDMVIDEEYAKLKNNYSGAELRQKLRDALQARPENGKYHFVALLIGSDQNKENLQDLSDMLNISEKTCQTYTIDQIQAGIDKLRQYSEFIKKSDKLEEILTNVKSACKDGQLTVDEASKLRQLVQNFSK